MSDHALWNLPLNWTFGSWEHRKRHFEETERVTSIARVTWRWLCCPWAQQWQPASGITPRHPGSPPRLLEMGERCPCAPARIKPTDFYPQSLVIRICSNKALVPSHTCITVAQEIKRHLKRSKGWDLMAAWCNIRIFLFVFRQLLSIKCTFLLAEHSRDEFYGLMLQNTLDNTLGSVPALETWSSLSEESFWLFIQKSLSET